MKYTVCLATQRSPALLFQTLDVEKVAALPELAKIFSNGYFVTQVGDKNPEARSWYGYHGNGRSEPPEKKFHVLVSTHLAQQEPDKAPLEGADLRFFIDGKPHALNLRQRYNQCLSLFKAVGCSHCPDRGMKCLSEGVGFELPQRLSPAHQEEDLWDHMRENFPKLGEFTLVKPGSTRTAAFSKAIRSYWEHDFDEIEKNAKKRSEASSDGAATKKFKKTQCVKCVIKDSCDRSKWCKGAYPPLEEIVEMSDRRLTEELRKSHWPEWQLWEVARHVGETAKHSRWNIILTGLTIQGSDGIHATVHRSKGSITQYGGLKTYEDIAKMFKLALTEDKVPGRRGPVKDRNLRAVLWLALKTGRGHQSYGWGHRRYITGVGCNDHKVSILWTNGKYLSSYATEIDKVSQVASHLSEGHLGDVDKVEVRP